MKLFRITQTTQPKMTFLINAVDESDAMEKVAQLKYYVGCYPVGKNVLQTQGGIQLTFTVEAV